jgi:hypothetical protein
MTLLVIDGGHFNAGLVLDDGGKVTKAAPILGYMRGWGRTRVDAYTRSKGWSVFEANEQLPAGSPMVFVCDDCGEPITVPENYVDRPHRCDKCGGEWSLGLA